MPNQVTGLILAGGRATRMGEVNKGAQYLGDISLFDAMVKNVSQQVERIVVSANTYADFYKEKGFPVIEDDREGFLGPLSGIESVLKHNPEIEWLFCTPVDTPFIPDNLVDTLYQYALNTKSAAVFPTHDGFREPLHCLVHRSLLPSLSEFLDSGERSVGFWLRGVAKPVEVEVSELSFANINTIEELKQFSKQEAADHGQ